MASNVTRRQLIIQNENLDIHRKKVLVGGKIKNSETASKKGGAGFRSRKALNDITNKSSVHQETSSKKKNLPKEEFNVAEEMFLHDHEKCIEAQQAGRNTFYLDMVLPGHDSISTAEYPKSKQTETDLYGPRCYPEPVEMPMSEFSEWFSSTRWVSPPCSPIHWYSSPSSPLARQFEEVDFVLKEGTICDFVQDV